MSTANPLWGAPRIHGELLKLGIEVSQVTVAKYMVRRRGTFSRERHLRRVPLMNTPRTRRVALLYQSTSDPTFVATYRQILFPEGTWD